MFNMNEHLMYRLNESHREELRRQMQQLRLAQAVQARSQPVHESALVWLGGVLVTLGTKLQASAEPEQTIQQQESR